MKRARAVPDVVQLEMGITHADFFRIFPRVPDGGALRREHEAAISVAWPDGRSLQVSLSAERVRRIALLRIPCVDVTLRFHGFDDEQRAHLVTRFHRAFQKGGG